MKHNQLPDEFISRKRYHVITSTDPNVGVAAGCIFFQNQGTTRVLLDDHIVLDPGESYSDMEMEGGIIEHSYSVKFIVLASPPTADEPRIYSGNRLLMATITRKKYL
jgi:hypothetical protein